MEVKPLSYKLGEKMQVQGIENLRIQERQSFPMERIVGDRPTRVLVAGLDLDDNQFVRAVEGYGFEAVHHSGNSQRPVPLDCDAAIIVVSSSSHHMFYTVKDEYKKLGKRVFIANQGFSQVKEDFERYFFGETRKMLEPLSWSTRMQFLACQHFKTVGTSMKLKHFLAKVQRIYPEATSTSNMVKTFTITGFQNGMMESVKWGVHRFNGVPPKLFEKMKSLGLPMQESWRMPEKAPEPKVEAQLVLVPQPTVEPAKAPAKITIEEEVMLLMHTVSDMDKKISAMSAAMNGDIEDVVAKVAERLRAMPPSKARAVLELIGGMS